jgi:hypothetical protein
MINVPELIMPPTAAKPNWPTAMRARAQIDDQLNKTLALLAPAADEQHSPQVNEPVADYITARMNAVRRALTDFEDAMKGTI